ncbi:MAG: PHP domain-containing protein [Candidatus Lernaella stagnicola]|nr:PHP domain-containing protein [Candidatus Lernaella stagnicola]
MIRIDCHSHSAASWDALTLFDQYLRDAESAGLDAVIVTDHNTLDGYHRLREIDSPVRLIPGVEINTRDGEVLAYFVDEAPPAGRSVEWTVDFIHDHGGLVVLPHIFARSAPVRLRPPALWRALELCDAVEGLNARVESASADARAVEYAARFGKPLTAGSDAHVPGDLGRAYLQMEDFEGPADFLAKLAAARPVLHRRSTMLENLVNFARIVIVTRQIPRIVRDLLGFAALKGPAHRE